MSYVIGDDVLAQASGSSPSYLLYDGHGSTRQVVSAALGVTTKYNYDAYGVTLDNSYNPTATSLRYCGEQYDATLGMYNLRARYYAPSTGRFNQRDSFEGSNDDPQSLHKYAYAQCDPVNSQDPSGNFTLTELVVTVTIVLIVVGIAVGACAKLYDNTGDRAVVQRARRNAEKIAARAIERILFWHFDTRNDFFTWFGRTDPQTKSTVLEHYRQLSDALRNNELKPGVEDHLGQGYYTWRRRNLPPDGSPFTFAATHMAASHVELYDSFFKLPDEADKNVESVGKSGALLHEYCHMLSFADDITSSNGANYGKICALLALQNPDGAICNADNYRLFAESPKE
jgi:RHS repeat-associated protein